MAPLSLEGKTLGKYRVLEPLGRGGMAQVFKAYHPLLDRYVAIKVLRSDLVEDEEFLGRFRREARAVAGLRHPNIVQVFDFDSQDDFYYMVMELLEGITFKTALNTLRVYKQNLDRGELVKIFSDVLEGLSYAHERGIIHRDLKPANIMLTKQGQAVLTDFGISQIIGGTKYTVSGALMGTLSYMAPEQALEGRSDNRSDIYSLGITFYEALTGSVPFDADTPLAVLLKHLNDPLPLPTKLDATIPESFERITMKALAKNPDDRFSNAVEMSNGLHAAAIQEGIEIPKSLTLPQSITKHQVTDSHVEIFSGESRKSISDTDFAARDTMVKRKTDATRGIAQIAQKIVKAIIPPPPANNITPKKVTTSILYSGAVILGINIFMLWIGGILGWKIFSLTWPLEFVGIGLLLFALMASLANPWMFIPAAIVLGNGFLLTYFTLTGRWGDWTLLWPLEPILIGLSIISPFSLLKKGQDGRWSTRRIGIVFIILSVIFIVFSLATGVILIS